MPKSKNLFTHPLKQSLYLLTLIGGGIAIISLVLIVNHFVLSWTEPTSGPPGGFTPQKPYALSAHDGDPADVVYVDDDGNVGIGALGGPPSEQLDVDGNVKATAFLYSSDRKLKQNIQHIQGKEALNKIKQLEGVRFEWKDTGEASLGLIAQEVEDVFPELVKTDPGTGLKSLQYANLIAPLIEAVKEQQREINNLRQTINNQQREIKELKKKLKDL